MLVGAQDPDQAIVVDFIPGPLGSDLVSIETLEDYFVSPVNPPLTNLVGPELLQLNPDVLTHAYICSFSLHTN